MLKYAKDWKLIFTFLAYIVTMETLSMESEEQVLTYKPIFLYKIAFPECHWLHYLAVGIPAVILMDWFISRLPLSQNLIHTCDDVKA